jgi:hypothetical protein
VFDPSLPVVLHLWGTLLDQILSHYPLSDGHIVLPSHGIRWWLLREAGPVASCGRRIDKIFGLHIAQLGSSVVIQEVLFR